MKHKSVYHHNVFYRIPFLLLILSTYTWNTVHCSTSASFPNAYKILGVSSKASQEEIRQKYRQLCLKYHPDKNVGKSEAERKKYEETFKQIQKANSDIGDIESREKYDQSLLHRPSFSSQFNNHGNGFSSQSDFAESILRSYYEQQRRQQQQYYYRQRSPFYVNGIDVSGLFPNPGKSTYMTQIPISLSDLYSGKDKYKMTVNNSILSRYKAAFRGGAARKIATQGLISSIAILLRSGWTLSICFFGIYFHCQLPQLNRTIFSTTLKPGWKSGTKIKFKDAEPGIDVVFVLKEQKDKNFERVGNDLITNIKISKHDFKKQKKKVGDGRCRLHVKMFDEAKGKIEVLLNRKDVTKLETDKNVEINVKGRGWPIKNNKYGDLKVKIELVNDRKTKNAH